MRISRSFGRSLLVILVVAGCIAAAVAPMMIPAQAAPKSAAVTHIIISEFSARGKDGPTDEFVELYNPTAAAVDINGYTIKRSGACDSSLTETVVTIAATAPATQVMLGAGQHYLIGGLQYSGSVIPDLPLISLAISETGGIGLFAQASDTTPVDAVGMCATTALVELPELPAFPTTSIDESYDRNTDSSSQSCVDTNHNNTDFFLRVPSDPQNTASALTICSSATPAPAPTANFTPTNTPLPGYLTVVINEIAWAGTQAESADQWIELYNPNSYAINLTDWRLQGLTGTIGTSGVLTFAKSGTPTKVAPKIAAHGYFVIAQNKDEFDNITPDYIDPNLNLLHCSTCGERLTLYSSIANTTPVDYANYYGGKWPAGSNASASTRSTMERHSATSGDMPSNWYTFAGNVFKVKDRSKNVVRGTPGYANWATTVTATAQPTATHYKTPTPLPPTPFGHMVINEFLPRAGHDWNHDGAVDVYDEFIEVKNLGPIDVNLSGWKIDDVSPAGSSSFSLTSKVLKPGERAVYYGATSRIALHDSGGTVRLINNRAVVIDARGYGPVASPDQTHCRLPDGYYWRFPCFPTPGLENEQSGVAPIPPPSEAGQPTPCLLADTVPDPFRLAECNGYGSDIFSASYWDNQSGFLDFPVPDVISKWEALVR